MPYGRKSIRSSICGLFPDQVFPYPEKAGICHLPVELLDYIGLGMNWRSAARDKLGLGTACHAKGIKKGLNRMENHTNKESQTCEDRRFACRARRGPGV
jgi:hypothetical protein